MDQATMDSEAEVKAEANLPLTATNEEVSATIQSSDLGTSEQKHEELEEQVEGDGVSKKGRKRLLKQEIRKDAKKIKKLRDREKKKGTNSRSFRLPPPPSEGIEVGCVTVTDTLLFNCIPSLYLYCISSSVFILVCVTRKALP